MGILDFLKPKPNQPTNAPPPGVPTPRPVALIVLDGYGIAPKSPGNAISLAKTTFIDNLANRYPHGELIASGESVGLPANEVGNTEVGHLTIGAGRVILQDLKRINLSIEDGSFFDTKAFLLAEEHLKKNQSNLHLLGMTSSGKVHSSVDHLYALLKFCQTRRIPNVYLHLITDGRDAPPQEGLEIISKLEKYLAETKVGSIATVSGRYYAMDRDKRWDRTQKAYDTLVSGQGNTAKAASFAIKNSYDNNITDEFIEPTLISPEGQTPATINDNDAVIFYNFRVDRPRQLSMALIQEDFESLKTFDFGYLPGSGKDEGEIKTTTFKRNKVLKNLFFVTMTEYHHQLPVSAIAFPTQKVVNGLAEIISKGNLKQLRLSESEKERFITYFFDGMKNEAWQGEETIIIPSPRVKTYDKKPEMSVKKITKELQKQLNQNKFSFMAINIANPDMVAHSGNIKATVKAIEHVDHALSQMIPAVLSKSGVVIVTADHGNAEELLGYTEKKFFITSEKGDPSTDHSNNPVPVYIISNELDGQNIQLHQGRLGDLAPTILTLLNLNIPQEMTGQDLLKREEDANKKIQPKKAKGDEAVDLDPVL